MPKEFNISRRKALAALGTIGVASAGAGVGTTAFFNDTESFANNSVQAGQLNLVVDYYTSYDQGQAGSNTDSGEVDGNGDTEYSYTISDAKPGDSGKLAFCPKVIDNPGYVWVGSSGVTDYENGYTEPEADVADEASEISNRGGSASDYPVPSSGTSGKNYGELSESIEITSIEYAESVEIDGGEVSCKNTTSLNYGSQDNTYTLADLASDLSGDGFQLDGESDTMAYPPSNGPEDQEGPCLCIHWEIPTSVENEIQTDSVEFSFEFQAEQERHNENPDSPFSTSS